MLGLLLILTCPHVTLPRPVRVGRIKGANLSEPKASLFVPPTDACWTWGPAQRATAAASPFFAFFLWRSKERRWQPGHSRQLSIHEEKTGSVTQTSKQGQTQLRGQNKNAPNNRGVLLQPADRVFQCINRHQACLRGGAI